MRRTAAIFALAGALSAPAWAADAPPQAPVIHAVEACRTITDDAQRLACYDKAVSDMQTAEAGGDLVTVDRAQRRAARKQAFGFNLPSLSFLERGEKPDEVNRVTLTVADASRGLDGRWVLRMDDGAVWRQTDDTDMAKRPHAGSTAEVRRGALGSFFLKVDGGIAVRAHRDN